MKIYEVYQHNTYKSQKLDTFSSLSKATKYIMELTEGKKIEGHNPNSHFEGWTDELQPEDIKKILKKNWRIQVMIGYYSIEGYSVKIVSVK